MKSVSNSKIARGPYGSRASFGFTLVEAIVVIAIVAMLAGIVIPSVSKVRTKSLLVQCASNQRQIGLALQLYANDNEGIYPPTTHSVSPFRLNESWLYELDEYFTDSIDTIRICPADPEERRQRILDRNSTSYVLNDLVFDDVNYRFPRRIPNPAQTHILFILSEDRTPNVTRDHIHGGEWTNWISALNDIEPDRHRTGNRSSDRTKGSAPYLFADGHVEIISASDFKDKFAEGVNPAEVPL